MTRKIFLRGLSAVLIILVFFTALIIHTEPVSAKSSSSFSIIVLSTYNKSMSIGDEFYLIAVSTTGKIPTFKSSDSSVASVNTYGLVTAKKKGSCKITAKVSGAESSCKVTVEKTTITLSATSKTLYRTRTYKLNASSSTGHDVSFKSNKTSVAVVDDEGNITALKHGTAIITASCDGTKKTCKITVKQPKIKLSDSTLNLTAGQSYKLTATVSSGVKPEWSSSNINVVSVDEYGNLTARQKGKAYIYAKEDGVKVSCIVKVTE
ncbi:MAG: Ig-like domain-containing protein [Eubacterium sp.]|nr:Ig-like domain-containing protein [Eubacterium sp.]